MGLEGRKVFNLKPLPHPFPSFLLFFFPTGPFYWIISNIYPCSEDDDSSIPSLERLQNDCQVDQALDCQINQAIEGQLDSSLHLYNQKQPLALYLSMNNDQAGPDTTPKASSGRGASVCSVADPTLSSAHKSGNGSVYHKM